MATGVQTQRPAEKTHGGIAVEFSLHSWQNYRADRPTPAVIATRRFNLAAAVLLAAFFLQSFTAGLIKSPSSDEPSHIAASLSYIQEKLFRANPEHPPLIKELAGVSLGLAGYRLSRTPEMERMLNGDDEERRESVVGNALIEKYGPRPMMFWARLPVIVLSTLLGLLIYIWGAQIAGDLSGLAALFLFAMDPNLLAHSTFLTTDMGMAAFGALFFFCLWHYLRRPGPLRLLCCGLTMGLALCAKFSAIFMIPMALPLMLASETIGLPVPLALHSIMRRLAACTARFLLMCGVAAVVIMAVYFSPAGLSMYLHGIASVYPGQVPNYSFYLAGHRQPRFLSYFAVAWLLKEPIAIIALVLLGSVILLRNRSAALATKLFVFLPPAALFLACTLRANNIGIRYIVPMFPFACLAGGMGMAWLVRKSARTRAFAAALTVWIVVAAAGIYPDHLSYFNEAACVSHPGDIGFDGGSKCGPLWLDDSNIDWGQGLDQLRAWLDTHPHPRRVRMAYRFTYPPSAYGIEAEPTGIGEFDEIALPGFYVISADFLANHTHSWLGKIPPTAIVGHAYRIYEIPRMTLVD